MLVVLVYNLLPLNCLAIQRVLGCVYFHQNKCAGNTRLPQEAAKIVQTPHSKKELADLWGFSLEGYRCYVDIYNQFLLDMKSTYISFAST